MGEAQQEQAGPQSGSPCLAYLGPEAEPVVLVRHPTAARRLAEEHDYLVARITDRLAACWPEGVDVTRLTIEGRACLLSAAATCEDPAELPTVAVERMDSGIRKLLAASEWYRQAMLGRARPLCDAWRGLVLAGRRVSDRTLSQRLRLPPAALADRFVEFAVVFVVEPGGLLPAGVDARYALAEIVSDLPSEQQLAVALYFHQELTFPEIARVMGKQALEAQELFGRAAAGLCAQASLSVWPATHRLTA